MTVSMRESVCLCLCLYMCLCVRERREVVRTGLHSLYLTSPISFFSVILCCSLIHPSPFSFHSLSLYFCPLFSQSFSHCHLVLQIKALYCNEDCEAFHLEEKYRFSLSLYDHHHCHSLNLSAILSTSLSFSHCQSQNPQNPRLRLQDHPNVSLKEPLERSLICYVMVFRYIHQYKVDNYVV